MRQKRQFTAKVMSVILAHMTTHVNILPLIQGNSSCNSIIEFIYQLEAGIHTFTYTTKVHYLIKYIASQNAS